MVNYSTQKSIPNGVNLHFIAKEYMCGNCKNSDHYNYERKICFLKIHQFVSLSQNELQFLSQLLSLAAPIFFYVKFSLLLFFKSLISKIQIPWQPQLLAGDISPKVLHLPLLSMEGGGRHLKRP